MTREYELILDHHVTHWAVGRRPFKESYWLHVSSSSPTQRLFYYISAHNRDLEFPKMGDTI